MRRISSSRTWLGALAAVFAVTSALAPCGADAQALTVFAAASLQEALDDAAVQFRKERPAPIAVSYAASSALAKQIENGAPADIFISADLDWMDYLEQRKLIRAGTRASLLGNRLVLIAPAGNRPVIDIKAGFALAHALGDRRLAMADPDSVPAGKYGRAALEKLGVWDAVKDKLARGENVRAALNFVARGEAPLGIVYRSDALTEKRTQIVAEFPRDSHAPIIYPVGIVASSRSARAPDFAAYLRSPAARAIFEKYGFTVFP